MRQHTVQKRLLSNFSSTPERDYPKQLIWIFDKKEQNIKEVSLTGVAIKKNFLTIRADDNITELEKECYPVIDRIAKKGCVICSKFNNAIDIAKNWAFLYRYIGLQYQRTIYQREQLENLPYWRERGMEGLKEYHSSLFQFNPEKTFFIDFGFGRAIDEYKKQLAHIYNSWIERLSAIELLPIDGLTSSIFDISLPITIINESQIPYIQNDIGLAPFFPLNFEGINMFLDTAEKISLTSILAFPISPKICIHLCTIDSVSNWAKYIPKNSGRGLILESQNEQNIKLINAYLLRFAKRYVYSNQKITTNFF